MLRLLAQRRAARRRDPAIAAWHRRRALAETELVAAPAQPVPGRLWLELNPLTRSTPASRKRMRDADRERLTRIAAGGGYVSRRPIMTGGRNLTSSARSPIFAIGNSR